MGPPEDGPDPVTSVGLVEALPASAREPGGAFHVDPRPRQLQVIAAGGAGLADLTEHRVLGRSLGRGEVGQAGELRVALRPHGRLLIAERPTARRKRRQLLALLGRWRTLAAAARAVLLGLELLELGPGPPPFLVELEHPVHPRRRLGSAAGERGTDGVRFASDQLDVENGRPLVRYYLEGPLAFDFVLVRPLVFAGEVLVVAGVVLAVVLVDAV